MTQMPGQPNGDLDPDQLMQMGMSYTTSRTLSAGLQPDVFSHLVAGPATARVVVPTRAATVRTESASMPPSWTMRSAASSSALAVRASCSRRRPTLDTVS